MPVTFANLPPEIQNAIETLLACQENTLWVDRAQKLHEHYQTKKKGTKGYINDMDDVLAYLGMRVPATYAQLFGAMTQVKEVLPSWQPKSVLDIGCGPGTGVWAAKAVWESIESAVGIDEQRAFLQVGERLAVQTAFAADCTWIKKDVRFGIEELRESADLVILGNVLNELHPEKQEKLLGQAFNAAKGVLIIVEPGTPGGCLLAGNCAEKMQHAGALIAPYINNSFVMDQEYWLHFSQRFIRPGFQRRIRQHMRSSSQMASDWEDAKFAYTAIAKIPAEITPWGRCVGLSEKQKGFLTIPLLTAEKITKMKVFKRDTRLYHYAKGLKWGEIIMNEYDMISI